MIAPALKVEMAVTTRPTETPSWTDITQWVYEVTTNRGRQYELDRVEAGRAAIVLDNDDRRFDPHNARGPYYPNLKVMRRVRVSAVVGSVTYYIFTGYVTSWPQEYPGGTSARVRLEAYDGFRILARKKLNGSYAIQTTDARVRAVLDAASWTTGGVWILGSATDGQLGETTILGPVGDRRIDSGISSMQAMDLQNIPALDHLQECALVEDGLLYVDGQGLVVFENRHKRLRSTDSYATFGDGTGELGYSDIELVDDDSRIFNEVRVSRDGGEVQTATDDTSQAEYFPQTLSIEGLPLEGTDEECKGRANYKLYRYKDPQLRFSRLTFSPFASDEHCRHALARDISDRITVVRRPPGGGDAITQQCHIEGISHEIKPGLASWQVTWQLSPADTNTYWILGDSACGQLSFTTRLAY